MRTGTKILSVIGLSAVGSVIGGLMAPGEALAAVTQPSVTLNIGAASGNQTIAPTSGATAAYTNYQIPVSFTVDHVETLQVSIRATNGNLTSANGDEIGPVAGSGAPLSAMTNTWGYRWVMADGVTSNFGSDLYYPVPTSNEQIYNATVDYSTSGGVYTETSKTKVLNLDFGAAVNGSQASGSYTTGVEISAVAMPKTIAFYTITYMNEMTDAVCDSVPTPSASLQTTVAADIYDTNGWRNAVAASATNATYVPQTTLIDQRNNKTYLVRKLADGNCWMAQNLELDLLGVGQKYATAKTSDATAGNDAANDNGKSYFGTTAGTISFSSATTDLPDGISTWTWDGTTITSTGTGTNSGTISTTVYATSVLAKESTSPEYAWKNDGSDGLRSYSYPGTAAACATAGTIDTTVADASSDAATVCATSAANWNYSKLTDAGNDSTNATFTSAATGEAYERYGNLYNWTAATLGYSIKSGVSTDGTTVSGSICPKGWTLPANTGEKSWVNLLSTYAVTNANVNSIPAFNKMPNAPLNFLRTGYYGRSYGHVGGRLTDGYWWSDTAGSATYAHVLYTWPGRVYPQGNDYRGHGFAVRCVAR